VIGSRDPRLIRLSVAAASLLLIGSTLTPLWVGIVRTTGGSGYLNIYDNAPAWGGFFGPWLALATVAIALAAATAVTGLLLRRVLAARLEALNYLAAGGVAAAAVLAVLWVGPGGSRPEGFGFIVYRNGPAAHAALLLAGVVMLGGLLLLQAGRRLLTATAAIVVVAFVVTLVRPVPVVLPAAAGPLPDWQTDPNEPYPFSGVVPPSVATPVDGVYDRDPTDNYPGVRPGCVRCQPYPLDAGRSVLTLDRGRFRLEQVEKHYVATGHYVVTNNHITFFNDVECGKVRGVYRWRLEQGQLDFTPYLDLCAFGQRARDLTDRSWVRLATP
jgi:hypothetical protein